MLRKMILGVVAPLVAGLVLTPVGAAVSAVAPAERLAGTAASQHRIVTTPDGWAVAAWTRTNGASHRVQVAVRTPAGAWRRERTLTSWRDDSLAPVAGHLQLVVAPRGRVMAVWVSPGLRLVHSVWRPGRG
ncbi:MULTISPECIES: hypothetical protein [unclassified Nocardioides]|uniref:hypothetical protein n=1 Tax=unclassified Nocardioides TaxID=2615069 RepID=UPI00360F623F